MLRHDPAGVLASLWSGFLLASYTIAPSQDPVQLILIIAAILLGALINVLWQLYKGGEVLRAVIAGLLAVVLGLFLANVFSHLLKFILPGLDKADALSVIAAASVFGVPIALRIMDRLDRN